MQRILILLTVVVGLVLAPLLAMRPAPAAAQEGPAGCARGDVNCDQQLNILDLQAIAAHISQAGAAANAPDYDIDGDGAVDTDDLSLAEPAWRFSAARLGNELPRLGYAVDPAGQVFLRWQLPVSPYEAPVEVLRRPAPPGAPPAGRPGVGVVARVEPIYDDATALPLLGASWDTLRVAFRTTTDADGNQVADPLPDVAAMQQAARDGANDFVIETLSNSQPGVAQVFGKGYLDASATPAGMYTYWIRVGGRIVGPVRVDTAARTRLPAPTGVSAFEGSANATGAPGTWTLQSQLRVAHASAFVTWDTGMGGRQAGPEWQYGYDVYRKACDPTLTTCSNYVQVNSKPVLPKPLPSDALNTEIVASTEISATLSYGAELQEFVNYWADHNLDPALVYCYRVAALDMLGQAGRPSAEAKAACVQPPDYLPPDAPEIAELQAEFKPSANSFTMVAGMRVPPDTLRNADFDHWEIYTADHPTAAWPAEWRDLGSYGFQDRRPIIRFEIDRDLSEHTQRWYRAVAVDAAGNISAPSTPALGTVDDTAPPAAPLPCLVPVGSPPPPPGCIKLDDDAVTVNIYRKFAPDGLALLVDQAPAAGFNWLAWSDSYTPSSETNFYYELRAVDEAGNLSEPSIDFSRVAATTATAEPGLPVITAIDWSTSGTRHDATIRWSVQGADNASEFEVYRSEGDTPPASIDDMAPVTDGIIAVLIGLQVERRYSFVDKNLDPNALYWYAIRARGRGAAADVDGEIRATRYIAVGAAPEHPVGTLGARLFVTPDGVEVSADTNDCCIIVLRSRDGAGGFSQITPIIHGVRYLDNDVRPGDSAYYQVLTIDAGVTGAGTLDLNAASGELLKASQVLRADIPPAAAPGAPAPLAPPLQLPIPPNAPAQLHFGANWTVQVRRYDLGSNLASASGDGALIIEVGPGDRHPVWVQFDNIQIDASGRVLGVNPGGAATVEIGDLTPTFPERMLTTYTNMRLDQSGATADLTVLSSGPGLQLWNITPLGPGSPLAVPVPDQPIKNPTLQWERVATAHIGQSCTQIPALIPAPFAVDNLPLYIVPTDAYTVTEKGFQFGATCTLYRDMYSGLADVGAPITEELDYRNDGFLRPSYSGTGASYTVAGGLSGSWSDSGPAAYTAAWPFGFNVGSASREFSLAGGELSGGSLGAGALAFTYATGAGPSINDSFAGTFGGLSITAGGAISGTITAAGPVHWTAFTIGEPSYGLYIPAAQTAGVADVSWTQAVGASDPGLNAGDRDLSWSVCPNMLRPPPTTFAENDQSTLDLYLRRSGVTGRVDFSPDPLVDARVSGYDTQLTRFAYSWLSNLEAQSGIAGRLSLPYPAEITLDFDSLNLDSAGCVAQGSVLPEQKTLAYWHLGLIPRMIDFRQPPPLNPSGPNIIRNDDLWVIGDYQITNLTQVEGAADDLVAMESSFAPSGNFIDSQIYAEETVYAVDGFYTVVKDLRLSDYAGGEAPGWDASVTTEAPPDTLDGFIELTAGVYLTGFGEASDPNSAKIYLLGDRPYIGFDRRPAVERTLSDQLDITLGYDLAYAQASGGTPSRWLGNATLAQRSLDVAGVPIVQLPYTLVATPDETRLLFGFPAPAGLLLAADAAYSSWGRPQGDRARLQGFRATLKLDDAIFDPDLDFAVAALGKGYDNYATLVGAVDQAIGDDGEPTGWLADIDISSLRVQLPLLPGIMANGPLQIQLPRGEASIVPVRDDAGRVVDGTLDQLDITAFVQVYQELYSGGDQAALLQTTMLMRLDPQGSVYLAADRISSSLIDGKMTADADMRLLFSDTLGYGVEGGLTFYDYKVPAGTIDKVGAVAGFTLIRGASPSIGLLYVGATLDADIKLPSLGRVNFGGSMLYGRIDPGSPVLQDEYGDLFDDMDAPAGVIIQGGYFLAYANNIPIYSLGAGCVGVRISGGGSLAFWAFNRAGSSDSAWGTRLGVNAIGEAFCVAAVKADITLQLDNDFGEDNLDLSGTAWAGAGCGFCEPETWDTKAAVADDGWCATCIIDLSFTIPLQGSTTKSKFDFKADCPF